MSCKLKICLLVITLAFFVPHQAKAMDPVSIAILAPVAVKAAQAATPYVFHVVKNTGKCLFKMGKDVFEIFYLPYGLCKMTFGFPFGGFRSGAVYTVKGCIAPGKLVVHTLLLPVYMIGGEVNI